ncbi:Pentatricopeptide repeat superfamily protein isoform 1 [Hibiscus syriacus]|uniref:Pentatricopeptide repeat superfamily protein isoform 1 n=1 Tax=Hibiscus syriacus TaxID=106335 RepID=A0A6A2WJ94_HIBSY|nr:Pentatricopeptide repeat superfamily protein isoform 1 [Hibiscus syriacus]
MAAKPLTSEAISLTEKKMDMTLDDIIKMSKNTSNKGKKQQQRRIPNKSQRPVRNGAKDKAFKVQQYMNSRASLRQGVLAQRRSNFQGNRFPFAAEAAQRAAVAPFRNRPFNSRRVANLNKPSAICLSTINSDSLMALVIGSSHILQFKLVLTSWEACGCLKARLFQSTIVADGALWKLWITKLEQYWEFALIGIAACWEYVESIYVVSPSAATAFEAFSHHGLPMLLIRFPSLNILVVVSGMLGLEHHWSKGLQTVVLQQCCLSSSHGSNKKRDKGTQ